MWQKEKVPVTEETEAPNALATCDLPVTIKTPVETSEVGDPELCFNENMVCTSDLRRFTKCEKPFLIKNLYAKMSSKKNPLQNWLAFLI